MRDYNRQLDKKAVKEVLTDIADHRPEDYSRAVYGMKKLGDETSYLTGSSFSLDDLETPLSKRPSFLQAERKLASLKMKKGLSPNRPSKPIRKSINYGEHLTDS